MARKCVSALARVLLEKLNFSQLVMKFREYYGGLNYINFVHRGPKNVPSIGHISPLHAFPSHIQKINFNISIQRPGFQELFFF